MWKVPLGISNKENKTQCVKHIEEDKVNQPICGFLGKASRLKKK